MNPAYDITPMGEAALLFHPHGPVGEPAQDVIWRMADAALDWPGVTEAIAGVNNLLVVFDPDATDEAAVSQRLEGAWTAPHESGRDPVLHRIAVRYGGADGFDLPDVAASAGMSADEYVARHEAGEYVVMAIGAQPGFGFLGGLDPALAVPRRAVPRLSVGVGAVMIGGAQTSVATITSPSGWHVIGQTDARFFDPAADRPALLRLGDRIKFFREGA